MRTLIVRLVAVFAACLMLAGCGRLTPETPQYQQQSSHTRQFQSDVMERANAAEPPYSPNRFVTREAINRSLKANETSPWFVYALTFTGEPLFYVVSSYRPQNRCHSITNPDIYYHGTVRKAPAIDGVFYSDGGCQSWHVEDVLTGGLIELSGSAFTFVASEYPLPIETDRLIPVQPDE